MGLGSGHNTHVGKFREALLLARGHGAVERGRGVGSGACTSALERRQPGFVVLVQDCEQNVENASLLSLALQLVINMHLMSECANDENSANRRTPRNPPQLIPRGSKTHSARFRGDNQMLQWRRDCLCFLDLLTRGPACLLTRGPACLFARNQVAYMLKTFFPTPNTADLRCAGDGVRVWAQYACWQI